MFGRFSCTAGTEQQNKAAKDILAKDKSLTTIEKNMKKYVISLKSANHRREHILAEFDRCAVSFEFFDAATPDKVQSLAERFDINISDSLLSPGELACLFSHVCLWQKMIDDNLDYIAVFEDDIYLSDEAKLFLTDSNWIPNQCKLLKIEHFMETLYLGKSIHVFENREVKELKECNWGTAGYIISKDIANDMISLLRNQFRDKNIPIDHIMFRVGILHYPSNIYQLSPAICVQSDRPHQSGAIKSTLSQEREEHINRKRKIKRQLPLYKKIPRELKGVFVRPLIKLHKHYIKKMRQKVFFK